MSALTILSHHRKPLASMTDPELEFEHLRWTERLAHQHRWGDANHVSRQAIDDVEAEMRRRRVTAVRADNIGHTPFIVDDPGVPPGTITIMGAGKTRAEWVPSRRLLVAAFAFIFVIAASVAAVAGQRLVEINATYGARIV